MNLSHQTAAVLPLRQSNSSFQNGNSCLFQSSEELSDQMQFYAGKENTNIQNLAADPNYFMRKSKFQCNSDTSEEEKKEINSSLKIYQQQSRVRIYSYDPSQDEELQINQGQEAFNTMVVMNSSKMEKKLKSQVRQQNPQKFKNEVNTAQKFKSHVKPLQASDFDRYILKLSQENPRLVVTDEQREYQIRTRVQNTNTKVKGDKTIFKIVLIGDSGAGKTSLLLRFSDNVFQNNYQSTIGLDFKIRNLKVDSKIIKLQIWDTAGQERFKSLSQVYYRNSHGCIAVYDITNRSSFENLESQILQYIAFQAGVAASLMENEFDENSELNALNNIVLVGTKLDLVKENKHSRQVTYEEAVKFAHKYGLAGVVETSSKEDVSHIENDKELFRSLNDCFYISAVNCMDRKDYFQKKKSPKKSQGNNLKGLFSDSNRTEKREQEDFLMFSKIKESICGDSKNDDLDTSYTSMDESDEDIDGSSMKYSLSLKQKDNSSINLRSKNKSRQNKKDKKPKDQSSSCC